MKVIKFFLKPSFLIIFLVGTHTSINAQEKIPVILDADTGNEVDDLYALSRALIEPSWNILALNATHWQTSHWAIPETMENSHRLNGMLLGELGLSVKTRRGGVARMFDWGDLAQHSAAAYEIIQQANAIPEGQQLTVIALGALTNVASAIYIAPSIEKKLKLYWLGSTYDFDKGILKRQDFNCVMDVQALEILLMSKIEMHVIPINVAAQMEFDFMATAQQFKGKYQLGNVLLDRWYNHLDGGRKKRTIWDLSLIQAIIHPEWAEEVSITTSRDNGNKKMFYYKSIEVDKMKKEFFEKLNSFFEDKE